MGEAPFGYRDRDGIDGRIIGAVKDRVSKGEIRENERDLAERVAQRVYKGNTTLAEAVNAGVAAALEK